MSQDPGPLDVGRVGEPVDRRDRDDDRDDHEGEAVRQRGQDLASLEAECPLRSRGAGGQGGGQQAEGDRADVGEHVAGVGEERQRSGQKPADGGGNQHRQVDRQRQPHPPAAVGAARVEAVFVGVGH